MFRDKSLFFTVKYRLFTAKVRPNFWVNGLIFIVFRVIQIEKQTHYTFALVKGGDLFKLRGSRFPWVICVV